MRTQTHSLLSMGDVNFGQHSQLLTNSPLPPSHIWELLNAGGGLTKPLTEPQPGGVYVINLGPKGKSSGVSESCVVSLDSHIIKSSINFLFI